MSGLNEPIEAFVAANTRTYSKRAWSVGFDSSGALVTEWRVLYEVTVKGDGSIEVQGGDWLSKYSDAIHGVPWKVDEYGRRDPRGRIAPIGDVDRIVAGETIYHIPSVPKIVSWDVTLPAEVALTDARKLEIALEHLKKVKGINDDVFRDIADVLRGADLGSGAVGSYLDIGLVLADLFSVSGRAVSAASYTSEILGPAGVILGFVMIPVQMADLGRREFGVKEDAAIEATVAFAFDDPPPQPPQSTIDSISQMFPQDIPAYRENWTAIVKQAYAHLRMTATRQVKTQILMDGESPLDPELVLKLSLRMVGGNERYKLRRVLREQYGRK